MSRFLSRPGALALLGLTLAACGGGSQTAAGPAPARDPKAILADSTRRAWTRADADFMTGMISHHAQAITMLMDLLQTEEGPLAPLRR